MTNYRTEYADALEEINFKFWKQISDDYYKKKFDDPEPRGLKIVQKAGFLRDKNPESPKELEKLIKGEINDFDVKPDYKKLATIFDLIQAWGGRQTRWFYVEQRKKGQSSDVKTAYRKSFPKWQGVYLEGARLAQKKECKEALEAIKKFEEIKGIGISFASKHLRFWSNKYPVLDARINLIFGGRNNPSRTNYKKIYPLLKDLGKSWGCSPIKAENIVYTFSAYYFLNDKLEFNDAPKPKCCDVLKEQQKIAKKIKNIYKRQHPKK